MSLLLNEVFGIEAKGQCMDCQVRSRHVVDWFFAYDDVKQRYFVKDCTKPEWRPIVQVINTVLLTICKPKALSNQNIKYIINCFDGHYGTFDWCGLQLTNLQSEIMALKKFFGIALPPHRYFNTFLGIALTFIFLDKG
ncbi:hypothetical protein R1flu_019033 [Riccia fluitans]|uniref:Uncharacterized protein n=1 Tax=Riccia fluitans TaxID=41844 RepID=A0ABD1ZHV6_9MARC